MTPAPLSKTSATNPDDQLQFIDDHRVALLAGDYEISVEQRVADSGTFGAAGARVDQTFRAKRQFSVLAERFQIAPETVVASFPPPGSRGDWWRVLPHVILSRSTLPWERTSCANAEPEPPWVALLLFSGDEAPTPTTLTVKDLQKVGAPSTAYFKLLAGSNEFDESNSPVTVIDVDRVLLQSILPRDLHHTCHVRRRLAFLGKRDGALADAGARLAGLRELLAANSLPPLAQPAASPVGDRTHVVDRADGRVFEVAVAGSTTSFYEVEHENVVVIGNRLPQLGQRNVVHLVSLERRMTRNDDGSFALNVKSEGASVRLVSLHKWEFLCDDTKRTFKGVLQQLNENDRLRSAQFHLPAGTNPNPSTDAERYLRIGYVPLKHRFRQGGRGVSWFHGPLTSTSNENLRTPLDTTELAAAWRREGELVVTCSDELVILDRARGMLDVSYAAAWQLGRLLTLANQNLAMSMYRWKRRNAQHLKAAQQLIEWGSHLSIATGPDRGIPDSTLPDDVWTWLDDLSLLKHVPFGYLVPDERLLPVESLRLFAVDKLWLRCLRDGAFSIGRVTALPADAGSEPDSLPDLSGVLLRSEVVAGWPKMQVDGYWTDWRDGQWNKRKLKVLRSERLSPNVLLVIFEGTLGSVEISLPPEVLHFGFDLPDDKATDVNIDVLERQLRSEAGVGSSDSGASGRTTPIRLSDKSRRVVALAEQARDIGNLLGRAVVPSEFAKQMIAGTELVRFFV